MKITFLGTGTSHGVPQLDCMINGYSNCPQNVCVASQRDPRHNRTRSSILIENETGAIIIDISEDFRQQALRESIKRIDSVLITHSHADHIGGIPDIRSYTVDKSLPLYGSKQSIEAIRYTYRYIFDPTTFVGGGIPCIETFHIEETCRIQGEIVTPINVNHGNISGCYGFRLGSVAYIPDMKQIDDEEIEKLSKLDLLILNCLRRNKEHCTHLILPESIELARKIKPAFCYFTHMSHDIHYEIDSKSLDTWMAFSYDGLKVTV